MGSLGVAHGWIMKGGDKKGSFPKICHTYSTMMKLGTVIPYLKKMQNIYESQDTPFEVCWYEHFTKKPKLC